MTRNLGMTSRPASGAQPLTGSHYGDTRADPVQSATRAASRRAWSNLEGSNLPLFDSRNAPLKFGRFSQTMIDIATVIVSALLVLATGVGIAFAAFILFFVKL